MSSTFQSIVSITHVPLAAICSLYQNQRTRSWMILSVRKRVFEEAMSVACCHQNHYVKKVMVARTKLTVPT